ncbi:DNA-formamidopyrimidine glycosylase family protein [Rufibacter sediminis]|uniref:Endonuclease n=1 Tax=Rufibacter sediminis TaxID=2762756 RepID=A0ABR6VTF6_9BACT|nr:DNA-formamidopyrimidine glycosylase family protein [Rufibacter sediminis]MBC3540219.1 endonuclease [Rufibacter sediminis]
MPEGPEMVFLKEQAEQFVGQVVLEVSGRTKHIPFDKVQGQELTQIKTFGKEILFCFPGFALRVHLMFFGKYALNGEVNRPLELGLTFEDGYLNFYACDVRFLPEPWEGRYDWSADVLNEAFDPKKALEKIRRQLGQLICDVLLDQQLLAGVGNGIKNEVLFRARLHPESQVDHIPDAVLKNLLQECVRQSFRYLDSLRTGTVREHWLVYQQKECPRDRIPLRKEKIGKGQRSGYFCEMCQLLYHPATL